MSETANAKTILIVDDNPDDLRILGGILRECGYQVHVATKSRQALESVEGLSPDLILLDICLPEMDGCETCRRLKAIDSLKKIPVLFISTPAEVQGKVQIFECGGVDLIAKPFRAEEVSAKVETYLILSNLYTELEDRVRERTAGLEQAIQKLRQYKHIVSSTSDMLALLDTQYVYLAVNEAYAESFQKRVEDLIGHTVEEVFGEEFLSNVIRPRAQRCLKGEHIRYQTWFDFPVTGRKYMDVIYSPYLGSDAKVQGFVVIARDITERKKAEIACKESEEKYRLLVENTPVVSWTTDETGNTTFISENVRKIYGFTAEEIYSAGADLWWGRIHKEDVEAVKRAFYDLVRDDRKYDVEYRIRRKDGQWIWLRDQANMVEAHRGIRQVYGVFSDITQRKEAELGLKSALGEIQQLKKQLETENVYLKKEVKVLHKHEKLVGNSEAIANVLAQAEQVAFTDSSVLITGETGTGKELLAMLIHEMSPRKEHPLVIVNCAAIPAVLFESELFGREKGAYTGAETSQMGRFELADKSTIFLDEISELPPEAQVKLLRVLQEGTFEHLGGTKTISVDVRVIVATNRDLAKEAQDGRFRRDLFYRLNVFPIAIPPLRERREDIPSLIWAFVDEFNEKFGKQIKTISQTTMEALKSYPWLGNVRELKNVIERATILSTGPALRVELPSLVAETGPTSEALDDVQRSHILKVLKQTRWRVRGHKGAAEILRLKPSTLESRMVKLGIYRPERNSTEVS